MAKALKQAKAASRGVVLILTPTVEDGMRATSVAQALGIRKTRFAVHTYTSQSHAQLGSLIPDDATSVVIDDAFTFVSSPAARQAYTAVLDAVRSRALRAYLLIGAWPLLDARRAQHVKRLRALTDAHLQAQGGGASSQEGKQLLLLPDDLLRHVSASLPPKDRARLKSVHTELKRTVGHVTDPSHIVEGDTVVHDVPLKHESHGLHVCWYHMYRVTDLKRKWATLAYMYTMLQTDYDFNVVVYTANMATPAIDWVPSLRAYLKEPTALLLRPTKPGTGEAPRRLCKVVAP